MEKLDDKVEEGFEKKELIRLIIELAKLKKDNMEWLDSACQSPDHRVGRSRPGWGDFNPDLKFKDVPGILPAKFLLDSIHFLEWIFLLGYVMAL